MDITEVRQGPRVADVRRLFEEYASWLAIDLSFQGFAEELANLPGEYAFPDGTLLLGLVDGVAAGCVAVRRAHASACEMKRLYVSPSFQRLGLGGQLVECAIQWAQRAGYDRMLLDTLPSMADAQRMYKRLGFTDIPAYRPNPIAGTRYLELVLQTGQRVPPTRASRGSCTG
jgi:carbonic anhydrase